MIKNADTPAMPIILDYDTNEHNRTVVNDCYNGLTKREMFAMHAPEIPSWFIDEWLYNDGNYRRGGACKLEGNSRLANVSVKEMKKITKEWRYAYADLMLEDK